MKSEISQSVDHKPLKLPCLMKSENNIYIITETSGRFFKGTRVFSKYPDMVGIYGDTWIGLEPFEGSVTLSND